MVIFTNQYMEEALQQAECAMYMNEVPVGAVIVNRFDNFIIAKAYNQVEMKKNATLHAEIVAISVAAQKVQAKNLNSCDIYITLEPCAMCAAALSYSRIGRIFYAASDPKQGAVEHGIRFFSQESCFYKPEVYNGILAVESSELLKKFFTSLRKT